MVDKAKNRCNTSTIPVNVPSTSDDLRPEGNLRLVGQVIQTFLIRDSFPPFLGAVFLISLSVFIGPPTGNTSIQDALIHNFADIACLPVLRIFKGMVQRFRPKELGAYSVPRIIFQEGNDHSLNRIFLHEVLLMIQQFLLQILGERQRIIAASVDPHSLRPHLLDIGS